MRTFLSFRSTSVMASLLERDIVYKVSVDVENRWLVLTSDEDLTARILLKGILRQAVIKKEKKAR